MASLYGQQTPGYRYPSAPGRQASDSSGMQAGQPEQWFGGMFDDSPNNIIVDAQHVGMA